MKSQEITVAVNIKITPSDMGDIICTIFEGGSNNWIEEVTFGRKDEDDIWAKTKPKDTPTSVWINDVLWRGGMVGIVDDQGDMHELTMDKLVSGIKMYIAKQCKYGSYSFPMDIDNFRIDPGFIDAEGADCILQYALFNDLVYG